MKKLLLPSMFISALFFMAWKPQCLLAQELTVPDFAYGEVISVYSKVTSEGCYALYSGDQSGTDARPSGVFLARGYRWWGNKDNCGSIPEFNFPGDHGYGFIDGLVCAGPTPSGRMGAWGGVVTDPASRTIWCLAGFGSHLGCYPVMNNFYGSAPYGYLRKVVTIQSTGSLQPGDPVNIKLSYNAHRVHTGDGSSSVDGFLFMNKLYQSMWHNEYLKWADREMFLKNSPMLAKFNISLGNDTDDSTVTAAIGDTIKLELIFRNYISYSNLPGTGDAEGWVGERPPDNLFTDINYSRTDTIKKFIIKYGNSLTYDLLCLTQGAILSPLTPDGPNVDGDKDGISDAREKGVDGNNSTFDGNFDGIPDYKQTNVASFHTYDRQNYVTMVVPSGTELSQVKVTSNPSPVNAPTDTEFPFGFFDFTIDGLDPGEAVNVTLILHNSTSITKYYKYGLTPDNKTRHWYEFMFDGQTGAEINGNVITLHFVDGLRGDEDITVNCSIKEPGGPAISSTTSVSDLVDAAGMTVYPNPANDFITIQLNNIVSENAFILRIFSITGEKVEERIISASDANEEFVIPTNNLSGGIYLITLSGSKNVYKSKFIKLNKI